MYTRRDVWTAQTADDLSGAADHTDIFASPQRIKVHAVGALVTGTAETDGAATVQVDKTINSSTGGSRGAADAGSIVIPDDQDVAECVRDTTTTIFPFVMNAGEFLTFQVSSAATSGLAIYFVEYEPLQDTDVNEAQVTESA